MDLEQMKTENRGTYNFILLQNDFVNGFRDFGRAAIDEIIENEPALSGNDRWWDDIKKYNKENAPNYIFATDNKEVNTGSFDASGVAKWMLYMYSDGTLNTYLTGGCRAVSIEDCSPSAFNSALNSYMALRNYTAHSSADAEDLDTEDLLNLACLACWLTAHLYCSAQDEALAHMRHVRDEIAEELGRTIEPHDEYDLAFHQAKPWLEDHKSTPGTAAAKGGRSHASRHHSYGEGLPFPFEGGDITAPFLVGPWERPLNAQAIFPSQIGAAFPREYEHLCPEMPGAELEQGLLHGATRAYPPKELPEMDYASRQPFLKDIQFTKENGGKTKKALDLLSKGLYYATMASSFVVLLMWGGFCGLFGAKSAPFFVLVNMHDGQRDAIAHMFIDRCAHDLKTHRYKPLLAPGIALTLIYLYLESFPGSLFLADKSLPFCLQSSFLDLLFPVCGVAGSGCGTCRKHLQAVPPSGKHNRCRRVFLSVQDGACSRQDWLCCRPYADHGHLWKLSLPVPHHGDRLACHAGLFQDGNRFC